MTTQQFVLRPALSAPEVEKVPSGILDVVDVVDTTHWVEVDGVFESFNCLETAATDWVCRVPDVDPKDLTAASSWPTGVNLTAVTGTTCKTVGMDRPGTLANVERVFDLTESRFIEAQLAVSRFVDTPSWPAITDVTPTPGTAVSAKAGVALLEGHAAAHYAGIPILHMSRTIASLLANSGYLDMKGDTLITELGSKVAAGGGYESTVSPAGVAPAAGQYWIYATGAILLGRGEKFSRQEVNTSNNDVVTMVERPYLAVVDCYVAAALVKVE